MKVEDIRRMKSTEMTMLRMIWENTMRDGLRNEEIYKMTEVENIEEQLREQRLRWFGHLERMDWEKQ